MSSDIIPGEQSTILEQLAKSRFGFLYTLPDYNLEPARALAIQGLVEISESTPECVALTDFGRKTLQTLNGNSYEIIGGAA